jgi:hypothetical protein
MAKVKVKLKAGTVKTINAVESIVLLPLQGSLDIYGKFIIRGKGKWEVISDKKLENASANVLRTFVIFLNEISEMEISGKVKLMK